MTRRASLVASLAALALMGCERMRPRVCDEAALERAAELLRGADAKAAPSTSWSDEAIVHLQRACPAVPRELLDNLRRDYTGVRAERRAPALGGSEAFRRERDAMCADLSAWRAASRDAPFREQARLMYQRCELGRFELLEDAEQFSIDDLNGFIVHGWMVRNNVDEEVARGFTRGLLTASAPEPIVTRRCTLDLGETACVTLARRRGATLPRSSSKDRAEPGLLITASLEQLRFDDVTLPLQGGALAPSALNNHVIEALVPALRGHAHTEGRARFVQQPRVTLALDHRTPLGTVIDLMYTAARSGLEEFQLLVATEDHRGRAIRLNPPRLWLDNPRPQAKAGNPTVVLTRARRELWPLDEPVGLDWDDPARAEETLRAEDMTFPMNHAIDVHAADDVPLQRLVETLDVLRGRDCRIEETPDVECFVRSATLGRLDPIPRVARAWDQLSLSIAGARWEHEEAPPRAAQHEARLRAQVEDALPAIRTCLVEHRGARTLHPRRLTLVFGLGGEEPGVYADSELGFRATPRACVEGLFEMSYRLGPPKLEIELSLELPPGPPEQDSAAQPSL